MAQNIPWPRIVAESAAIVASILLAFAIDAWWQRRAEIEEAEFLVVSLQTDFQASQAELERVLEIHRSSQSASSELLNAVRGAELGAEIVVPLALILRLVASPSYSPTTSALDLAFSSGRINLIEDYALRNILASWRQQIADTAEEETLLTEIATHRLIPEFSKQVRLGALNVESILDFLSGTSPAVGYEEDTKLVVTSELEGVLSWRVFVGSEVVPELVEIGSVQREVIRLLEEDVQD